jgi:hypothetical protein
MFRWSPTGWRKAASAMPVTWGLTATMATSRWHRHTSAAVHALSAAQDLAVCYT